MSAIPKSLRRKKTHAVSRPKISAPQAINPNNDTSSSTLRPDAPRSNSTWTAASAGSDSNSLHPSERRERPRLDGGNTSDLVKRRYSTRFVGGQPMPPQDGNVPAMPAMPGQYAASARSRDASRDTRREGRSPERNGGAGGGAGAGGGGGPGRVKIDIRALKDPHLSAEKYVQSVLSDASEAEIESYQNDLLSMKAATDADLQHNVYQNRTQFIKISKEADKLKSEMRGLRTLMGELTSALGHATSAGGAGMTDDSSVLSLADRKRANRSSVANLEAMWTTHLQTLWKRVEGSQKYLPALPGRHIILESQRWVELNAATWKAKRRVAVVLLNDHVLIATEKKRAVDATPTKGNNNRRSMYITTPEKGLPANNNTNNQPQTTLVADRCWPLSEVSLADISTRHSTIISTPKSTSASSLENAISLRAGNESFTYAIQSASEKSSLLVAFRAAQESQRKLLAAEHARREKNFQEISQLSGRDPRLLKRAAAVAAAEANATNPSGGGRGLSRSASVLTDHEGRPQSIRWVESQIDTLDIEVALQNFESAVERTESLRKMARGIRSNPAAQEIILAKVNERAVKLAGIIGREIGLRSGAKEVVKERVEWLLRLGFESHAQTTFLTSRTEVLRSRQRSLGFVGGGVQGFIRALSFVTFESILQTMRIFGASFPSSAGSVGVRWAKGRVDEFLGLVGRQLSVVESGGEVWTGCVGIVEEQAACLREVGVDFGGLVGRGLREGGLEGSGGSKSGGEEEVGEINGGGGVGGLGLGVST
ncbi:related to EXO84 protein, component of non-clathrin vesicle coat [Ramularia collo-cygni]|uniref:Exocyst complex component EXO84 n=1 Tax=Ramularia collo-cygni TaxID=112498 RepID=A0A2D3V0M2_9PEZI|nr:related to EXO84 protein, component of non-clathrin vesicle coat [Ramularia collo-cygni]CZT20265.1 related to EXO84 protein, component of non-clathrin vesicle coat [Ramularia collo-cygni]